MAHTAAAGDGIGTASIASPVADPVRARILVALSDGRALPVSVLAAEAGVAPGAAAAQLASLHSAGLTTVEMSGRHRHHRITAGHLAEVREGIARGGPVRPVRSLREGTRAARMRNARSCYDHLAGRLGVRLMRALLSAGALASDDGIGDARRRPDDGLARPLSDHPYRLGDAAPSVFADLGVDPPALAGRGATRPFIRVCVDGTEQEHHLAGRLGAAVLSAFLTSGWVVRIPDERALRLTPDGRDALGECLPIDLAGLHVAE